MTKPTTSWGTKDLEIQQVIKDLPLKPEERTRIEQFFKRKSINTITRTTINLDTLRQAVETPDVSTEEKIVAVIGTIAGGVGDKGDYEKIIKEASETNAWKRANNKEEPVQKKSIPAPAQEPGEPHGGQKEGGLDDNAVDLTREIENLRKDPFIARDPALGIMLKNIEENVQRKRYLPEQRKALNVIREGLKQKDSMGTVEGVTKALQNFEKTDITVMPEEGKTVFFITIVRQIYALGGRLVFLGNNEVQVEGPEAFGNFIASCKPKTKEWLKKGLILNSPQAAKFMDSMGGDMSKLTVDTFISTNKKLLESGGTVNQDILRSLEAGGYDILENGALKRGGFNMGKEFQTTQEAIDRLKKIGIVSPIREKGGAPVQIADLAYNIVKVGFVAGTVWKGTKAIWKTIFGSDEDMKKAWGEFGKTAAWTAGIWYGGELVKRTANNIVDRTKNGEFEPVLKTASPHHAENTWALWDKVGGGIVPERIRTSNLIEGFFPNTVDWYVFRGLMTDCFLSRDSGLANITRSELADAIEYRDHTPSGSHVGGIRELFMQDNVFGPERGEELYLRYFGNRKTAEQSYKVLREVAKYRTSGPDAVVGEKVPIWDLFAKPLQVPPENPFNVDPEMEKLKESLKGAGASIVKTGIKIGEFGSTGVRVVFEGIGGAFDIASDTLKNLTPGELAVLKGALAVLGLTAAGAGLVYGISLIPGFTGAKILAITGIVGAVGYGGYKLIDTAKGLINDPDKLIEFLKKHGPQNIKDIIAQLEGAGKTSSDLLKDLKDKINVIPGIPDWVPKSIDDLLNKIPGAAPATPATPGGGTTPAPRGAPATPPTPAPRAPGSSDTPDDF